MKHLTLIICMICLTHLNSSAQTHKTGTFTPGAVWPDDRGIHINAHGGGILEYEGRFYWYGEHKISGRAGNRAYEGVHVYSSDDLVNWKDEDLALRVSVDPASPLVRGCIIERPKVIYNPQTRKFVMWFHHELNGMGYKSAKAGVAVSNSATGPFTYLQSVNPNPGKWPVNFPEDTRTRRWSDGIKPGSEEWKKAAKEGMFVVRDFEKGQMARDMTLFADDDGKAYLLFSSEENTTLQIAELDDEFTGFTGTYGRILPGGLNEAPVIFKKGKRYYLITSGCTGWTPNAARSAHASSLFGPWTELGNPCVGPDAELTFQAQGTFVIPFPGKKNKWIFMADRWNPTNAIDGRYVWLPVEFKGKKPVIRWTGNWKITDF